MTRDPDVDRAEAAVHILTGAVGTGHKGSPTFTEAAAMLEHLSAKQAEWRRTVAWLASQLVGARAHQTADANLALQQMRRILVEHDERVARAGSYT